MFLLLWQRPPLFLFLESLGSSILHRAFEVLCCLQQASAPSLGLYRPPPSLSSLDQNLSRPAPSFWSPGPWCLGQSWGSPSPTFPGPSLPMCWALAWPPHLRWTVQGPLGSSAVRGTRASQPAGRGYSSADEEPLSTPLCRHGPHHSQTPGREPIHLGHRMRGGWDFSF